MNFFCFVSFRVASWTVSSILFKRSQTIASCCKFTGCVLLILQFALVTRGQANQESILPPPAQGLSSIHLPDTRSMEPEVQEHLASAQNALVSAAKDTATPADKLGEAYGVMGEIYQAYSLVAPAKECYLNAAHLAPNDFRWAYLLGKLSEREGDAQAAISYYNKARTVRSDYLPALVNLGNIHLQLNRLDEAEAYFKLALKQDENSAAVLYGLGQAALSKRNYADAASYLEKALTLAPEANRLHYALAMAYRGLGDMGRAQSQFTQSGTVGVRVSDPLFDGLQDLVKGARLHLIRGKTALDARRFAEAGDEFRKAIAAQPDSLPAHFNLGAALTQMGDLRGAIEQFEETLRLDPNHADAHYNLGVLLAQTNQHEQAIVHLQSAVTIEPTDSNARFLLAQEFVKARRLDEAETELSRVVQSDKENEDALLSLVKLLLIKKQYKQALSALEQGHAQFPQKGLTTVTLAYLLAASPQLDLRDGKRALELASSAYEASATVNHGALVAMALAELGRCDEAAALLKRLVAKAAGEENGDLALKLKADLERYEHSRPCRPAADITFSN
jgi:tetratricopeptide (TPR) repeat protein